MSSDAERVEKEEILSRLEAAYDRLEEAHWFLHGLEEYYHFANLLRWHLNAFLRPLKEVPQQISMAIQNEPDLVEWYRAERSTIAEDPLIRFLSEQRNFVVHRGMLRPGSTAALGTTEGRGLKFGFQVRVDPFGDSDEAMRFYVERLKTLGDPFGILAPDEDSLLCITRRWVLSPFDDQELVDLCATAWLAVAEHYRSVVERIGIEMPSPSLSCRHGSERVRTRVYDRDAVVDGEVRGYRRGG